MTEPPPDLPGLVFDRVLGSGGYSDVYLYRQQLPLRHVAVKVLKDSGLAEGLRSQLTAEANAMAGLADHPNIVPVFSAAVSNDGRPYIVMSYYSRPNLAVRAASERLGVAEVLRIGIQIASAVETAHRAGILHRDIKPANVLTNQYGVPGLTDFGIAGTIAAEDEEDTGVSVPWTAPEVLYAAGPTSVRSDVYALAATLWHLLVGRSPFEVRGADNSAFELMRRVRDTPLPPTGRADVPDSLDRLLRQAMAKDPATRVASAIDFARGLQAVELELHLPRTDIVVLTDRADGAELPPPPAGDAAATGLRGTPPGWTPLPPRADRATQAPPTVARPAAFTAQPAPPPAASPPRAPVFAPAPLAASSAPPTVARPTSVRAQPTTKKAAPVSADRPADHPGEPGGTRRAGAEPDRSSPRRGYLVLGSIAVVIAVAVVAGFVIFSGGPDGPAHPARTLSPGAGTQNAGQPGEGIPPGTPKIKGTRSAKGELVFTWTYSAPLAGDTFQWREAGGGTRRGTTAKPALRLPKPAAPTTTCIQVRVVRADGTNASATYSPKGCI